MQTSQRSLIMIHALILTGSLGCGSGHQFNEPSRPVATAPIAEVTGEEDAVENPSPVVDEQGTVSDLPIPPPIPVPAPDPVPAPVPAPDPVPAPVPVPVPDPVIPVIKDPEPVACSTLYSIPGIANPFLAGMPAGTEIAYRASVDRAPVNSPVLVTPTDRQCFEAGRYLYFRVEGKIAHGTMSDQESDADGIPTAPGTHTLADMNNLSNIKAPINSLIGIFLDDRTPAQRPVSPATLNFNEAQLRNFKTLAPQLGQIFFIGDGKDASGQLQSFTVPNGTTRLYLAIMDEYEWNNNLGKLSGGILWVKP